MRYNKNACINYINSLTGDIRNYAIEYLKFIINYKGKADNDEYPDYRKYPDIEKIEFFRVWRNLNKYVYDKKYIEKFAKRYSFKMKPSESQLSLFGGDDFNMEILNEKGISVERGPGYEGDTFPPAYIFKGKTYNVKDVFNDITKKNNSARDAKHRFYWSDDYKYWYTRSMMSADEAVKKIANMLSNRRKHKFKT